MFSTSVVVSLVLAVVFGAAALLLWRSRNHAPSSSDAPDPEPSGQKQGGSRIGACICLAVLALLSQFVCTLIYLVLFSIPSLLSFLPESVTAAMANYILPSLFGACFASMAVKKLKIALYALPMAIVLRLLGVPAWITIVCCIFGTILITYFLYKKKIIK